MTSRYGVGSNVRWTPERYVTARTATTARISQVKVKVIALVLALAIATTAHAETYAINADDGVRDTSVGRWNMRRCGDASYAELVKNIRAIASVSIDTHGEVSINLVAGIVRKPSRWVAGYGFFDFSDLSTLVIAIEREKPMDRAHGHGIRPKIRISAIRRQSAGPAGRADACSERWIGMMLPPEPGKTP